MPAKKVTPYDELVKAIDLAHQLLGALEIIKALLPGDQGAVHPSTDAITGSQMHVQRALVGLKDLKTTVDGWKA